MVYALSIDIISGKFIWFSKSYLIFRIPGICFLLLLSHTYVALTTQSVVRATKQVNGETQNLTPRHAQTR